MLFPSQASHTASLEQDRLLAPPYCSAESHPSRIHSIPVISLANPPLVPVCCHDSLLQQLGQDERTHHRELLEDVTLEDGHAAHVQCDGTGAGSTPKGQAGNPPVGRRKQEAKRAQSKPFAGSLNKPIRADRAQLVDCLD